MNSGLMASLRLRLIKVASIDQYFVFTDFPFDLQHPDKGLDQLMTVGSERARRHVGVRQHCFERPSTCIKGVVKFMCTQDEGLAHFLFIASLRFDDLYLSARYPTGGPDGNDLVNGVSRPI